MFARLKVSQKELIREVHRMIPRVERSGLQFDKARLEQMKILVESPDLDYYKIVSNVEAIL